MFAESETELRDIIVQNLESCGFLNKIKAELRAGVFLALSEEGSLRKKIPVFNKKLDELIETSNGKIALSIVREFLEFFNLGFTLSVFDPEIASNTELLSRADLCKKLNVNESDSNSSVLSALLKQKSHSKPHGMTIDDNELLKSSLKDFTSMRDETAKNNCAQLFPQKSVADSFLSKKNEDENKILELTETSKNNEITLDPFNKIRSDKEMFQFCKSGQKDAFKEQSSIIDPFFDEPVPSEKTSFLSLSSGFNEESKFPLSSSKGGLSSLRDLPSLTKQPSILHKDVSEDSLNPLKKEDVEKKDLDLESNEELSDKQMNSEESIEEEIEEDFSAGLDVDDLLNSSLSLGEDATSDQTVSQTSVVEGVDHIESCHAVD